MAEYVKNKLGLEILTDSGWQKFDGIVNKGQRNTVTVKLEKDSVSVTPDHMIYDSENRPTPAYKLTPGEIVMTATGPQKVVSVTERIIENVYDIINAGPDRRFYADDILCSNCEFIIADETLINPSTLIELSGKEPSSRMGQVRWYDEPKKGMIYAIALDPSLGTGGDYAAIQIFEANTTKQIGEWKHNKTDIPNQIKLLTQICKYIAEKTNEPNNIYYSIENNSIGEAALVSLTEFGENNIPGNFISEPGKKRKGFNTTHKSKLTACAKLKTLLESKKMQVHSHSLISEFKTFVAAGGSYAAKSGENDDLVMSTVLIVRMLQLLGDFHYELENQIRDYDEVVQPMPFFAIFG
jgi:hypothetical protein